MRISFLRASRRCLMSGALGEARVLIAGCGSGGGQVALQLAMSGIRKFALFDSDVLEPRTSSAMSAGAVISGSERWTQWPTCCSTAIQRLEIERHDVDLMTCTDLADHVRRSSVVVLATDNDPTRYRLNQLCVENKDPFVIGKVFTRGIGGEVFNTAPAKAAVWLALKAFLSARSIASGVREIDLVSDEERQKMYGLEIPEIKDSPGLNVDIAFITAFHTRFVLDAIARTLPERPEVLAAD